MASLVALDLPLGRRFVEELRQIWQDGDAALPVDQRLPPPAQRQLVDRLAPAAVVDGTGRAPRPDGRPVEAGDAVVVATSGSSGEPKGVVLTHQALAAHAEAVHRRLHVDPAADRWLACLPPAHVGGLGVVIRAVLTGTPLDLLPTFEAEAVAGWAVQHRGHGLTSLVVTALDRIDPSPLRWVVLGGSGDPAATSRPANVVHTYGLSESGGGVVYEGRPLDGIEVRTVDGQIQLRGAALLRAYRDGTDPKDAEGWLPTGDLGAVDPGTGCLSVDGRAGELIVTGGENVWPAQVEPVLAAHPSVAEVAVTGRDDPEWGQRVVAWVVVRDGAATPSLADLRAVAKAELPAHAAPREVVVVDALPRTALGKVRRSRLTG